MFANPKYKMMLEGKNTLHFCPQENVCGKGTYDFSLSP